MENAHSNRISQPEHGTPDVRALTSPALGGMVHAQNTTAKTYAQQLYANAMNPQSKDNSQNSVLRVDPVSVYQGKSSISYSPPSTRPVPSIVSNGTRPLDVVKGFSNGSSRYPTNQAGQTTGASVGAIGQAKGCSNTRQLFQRRAWCPKKRVAETQPLYSSPPSMLRGANRISLSQQLTQRHPGHHLTKPHHNHTRIMGDPLQKPHARVTLVPKHLLCRLIIPVVPYQCIRWPPQQAGRIEAI